MSARAVRTAATRLRESAQAAIVHSFRTYLDGGGPGPTDEELRTFARVAVAEQRVQRRFAGVLAEEEAGHAVCRGSVTMTAAAIPFSDRPGPAAGVAFGSLLDLARFHGEPAEGEVCEACQTINARHARFCKGCDGKLPAYFASVDEAPLASPLAIVHDQAAVRRYAPMLALVVLWGAVTTVALIQAFGPRQTEPLERAALPASIARAVALVDEVAAHPAQETLPRNEAPAASSAMPNAGTVADSGADRPVRKSSPRAVSTRARSNVAWSPVAQCGGKNFFARAVCMNNQCATPELRRSPQCAETVRQQQLGEARRNPKLLG
jgi:hypothetical protein